ncbi:MAG TPA: alpha/beta hydrolase-fold protein [Casimicrobiaceae bacterium]|nr:alpha/beta hydrolase-fold protein [Casimicrobiaceae bacterium]
MARKAPRRPQGTLVVLEFASKVLADNPLGDPAVRKLGVWLPPGYDEGQARGRGKRFPVLFDLVGFTGSGFAHLNWRPFDENVPERVARLIHEQRMGPAILVFADCFTCLGGNQYINSSAVGRYADYLTDEIIPLVDREFRTHASRDHRGCFGKSSGGYGAIVHGMRYAKHWGAVASHSGDAYFDFCYLTDWPRTLNELDRYRKRKRSAGRQNVLRDAKAAGAGDDDGRIRRFLDAMWRKSKLNDAETHALMMVAMAATYDPDPRAPLGFRIPVNLETGELIDKRWRAWLEHDPIHIVASSKKALKSLRGLWIDCGWRDQYHLHYGSRILSRELARHGIGHVYEEFDDNHSSIDYRMDASLPYLYKALKP